MSGEKERDVFVDILHTCKGGHGGDFLCRIRLRIHFFLNGGVLCVSGERGVFVDILHTCKGVHSDDFLCRIRLRIHFFLITE